MDALPRHEPTAALRHLAFAAPLAGFLFAALHLAWEATHGGVQSHHLLNRADLPAISNLWGLLVLPLLGGLAAGVVRRRAARSPDVLRRAAVAGGAALVVGLALSMAFQLGQSDVAAALFLGALASGVLVRSYRAEYLFGFVLGMAATFGAVLPSLVAAVAASVSLLAHWLVYPLIAALYRRLRGGAAKHH